MRRVLVALAVLLVIGSSARAAGMLIPVEKKLPPLALVDQKVTINIEDQIAVTRIEQTFRNHTSRPLEATYLFPVPKGASVRKFSMWVNGKEETGDTAYHLAARNGTLGSGLRNSCWKESLSPARWKISASESCNRSLALYPSARRIASLEPTIFRLTPSASTVQWGDCSNALTISASAEDRATPVRASAMNSSSFSPSPAARSFTVYPLTAFSLKEPRKARGHGPHTL